MESLDRLGLKDLLGVAPPLLQDSSTRVRGKCYFYIFIFASPGVIIKYRKMKPKVKSRLRVMANLRHGSLLVRKCY